MKPWAAIPGYVHYSRKRDKARYRPMAMKLVLRLTTKASAIIFKKYGVDLNYAGLNYVIKACVFNHI